MVSIRHYLFDPRPSKQEDALLDYIKAFAEERNLEWKQDAVILQALLSAVFFQSTRTDPVIGEGEIHLQFGPNRPPK